MENVIGNLRKSLRRMAGPTRLELATSCVTGRRSNQLNYGPGFVALGRARKEDLRAFDQHAV